jgi:hypothetical protein
MYREVLEEAKAFKSLPEEFALAEEEKGERRKLDEKVLQAFGVSAKADALTMYELLKEEPMIL